MEALNNSIQDLSEHVKYSLFLTQKFKYILYL